jgi:hypothetical protein
MGVLSLIITWTYIYIYIGRYIGMYGMSVSDTTYHIPPNPHTPDDKEEGEIGAALALANRGRANPELPSHAVPLHFSLRMLLLLLLMLVLVGVVDVAVAVMVVMASSTGSSSRRRSWRLAPGARGRRNRPSDARGICVVFVFLCCGLGWVGLCVGLVWARSRRSRMLARCRSRALADSLARGGIISIEIDRIDARSHTHP